MMFMKLFLLDHYEKHNSLPVINDEFIKIIYKKLLNTKIINGDYIWQLEKMNYNKYNDDMLSNINNKYKLEEIINKINTSLTPFLHLFSFKTPILNENNGIGWI